jgi:raffinose/stachyose/melibiose transport system permease protein
MSTMTDTAASRARPAVRRVRKDRSRLTRLLFLAPALIVSLSVVFVPLVVTVVLAFTNWNGFSFPAFIGFGNFQYIVSEPRFWVAVRNNLVWTSLYVTLPMVGGLLAAMMLLTIRRGRVFFQVVFFLPVTIATVVLAQVWKGMVYSPTTGLLGWLQQIGIPISNPLASPATSLFGVLFVDMWHWWGYLCVIYLAALRQVDRSLVEAAFVDGATRVQIFVKILLPLISPTIFFMLLMTIIWSFRVFDWIFIMTEGGPGFSSEVLGTLAYKSAFQQFAVGQASAYSVAMSLVGLVAIVIYLRMQVRNQRA